MNLRLTIGTWFAKRWGERVDFHPLGVGWALGRWVYFEFDKRPLRFRFKTSAELPSPNPAEPK